LEDIAVELDKLADARPLEEAQKVIEDSNKKIEQLSADRKELMNTQKLLKQNQVEK